MGQLQRSSNSIEIKNDDKSFSSELFDALGGEDEQTGEILTRISLDIGRPVADLGKQECVEETLNWIQHDPTYVLSILALLDAEFGLLAVSR